MKFKILQEKKKNHQGEPTLLGDHGAPHSCLEIVQLLACTLVAGCMSPAPTRKKKKVGETFHSFTYSFLVNKALEGIPAAGRCCPHSPFTGTAEGAQDLKFSPELP